MRKLALLVALVAAFGLSHNSAKAQSCPNGTCARTTTTPYRTAPMMTYNRGYSAPAYYAAPQPAAPASPYGYQPQAAPATSAAPQPTYQVAQARPYYYQRNYAAPAASCPNGTCAYTYSR